MQFCCRFSAVSRHNFAIPAHTLEVVDSINISAFTSFLSSGNLAAYLTVALRNLDCSYARTYAAPVLRHGVRVAAAATASSMCCLVISSALFGAEVLGVHSSTGRQRKNFTSRYVKHLWPSISVPINSSM